MAPPSRNKKHDKQTRSKKGGNSTSQGQQSIVSDSTAIPYSLPLELQQIILNTFKIAFPVIQDPDHLKQAIQEVKGHLFNRDFPSAFGQPSYLEAYALRWSAARALGYSHIFTHPDRNKILSTPTGATTRKCEPSDEQTADPQDPRLVDQVNGPHQSSIKVVCIGGGAGAEFVALAAAHRVLANSSSFQVTLVDSADWSEPVSSLSAALSTSPSISSHASDAFKARPENQPMLSDPAKVGVTFLHQDVLSWSQASLKEHTHDATLCTIMFTLNELFGASLPKTTALLLHLTDCMSPGSHLLVVDSPGSYSEIGLGRDRNKDMSSTEEPNEPSTTTKKYPMKWLLDHTLLEVANQGEAKWVKVEAEDSLWFRMEQKHKERLKYAIELENMRYQLHLYRRQ